MINFTKKCEKLKNKAILEYILKKLRYYESEYMCARSNSNDCFYYMCMTTAYTDIYNYLKQELND